MKNYKKIILLNLLIFSLSWGEEKGITPFSSPLSVEEKLVTTLKINQELNNYVYFPIKKGEELFIL